MSAGHGFAEGDAGRPRRVEPPDGQGEMPHLVSSRAQPPHVLWPPTLLLYLATASMTRLTDRGDVRVQFSHKTRWTFHPGALTKVHGGA